MKGTSSRNTANVGNEKGCRRVRENRGKKSEMSPECRQQRTLGGGAVLSTGGAKAVVDKKKGKVKAVREGKNAGKDCSPIETRNHKGKDRRDERSNSISPKNAQAKVGGGAWGVDAPPTPTRGKRPNMFGWNGGVRPTEEIRKNSNQQKRGPDTNGKKRGGGVT